MDFRELMPFGRERRTAPVQRGDHPMDALQREMHRLFDDFFRSPATFGGGTQWPFAAATPRIDMSESEQEYEVTAELPGLDEKDVELTLADNVLTISGQKKAEREEKDRNYYLSERSFGSFRRAIPLPTEVEEDRVEAQFKNGVLTVHLPKSPEARSRTRRIEVRSEA